MKIYVICYRDSSYRGEVSFMRAGVLVATEPPDVLVLRSGAIFELPQSFKTKEEAYRWWIKNGDTLSFPAAGKDITK